MSHTLIYGTDEYDQIQELYLKWSYGVHRSAKSGKRIVDEYEDEFDKEYTRSKG